MFERDVVKSLRNWANRRRRKPLILRGARQVGKTTVVNAFAKEFDLYLYLNLDDPAAAELFEVSSNVEEILSSILLYCNKARSKGRTLLFIDEIQNSKKAVAILRYFYEQLPNIYVIGAGSLLENMLNIEASFPVGRVEYMAVRPCSFIEFLGAIGQKELKKAVEKRTISTTFNSKVMKFFNTYTLVGGMPEAVSYYAECKDIIALGEVYETLLVGYYDDVLKYAKNDVMAKVIRYVLEVGWNFASQEITLGSFAGSSYKAREMGEAFATLEKTMLLELVYPVVGFTPPIIPQHRRTPKLIWLDVGLVNYASKIQKEVFGAKDILDAYRGHIAEQIVAQELLTLSSKVTNKRDFWIRDKKGSDAEVDFIILFEGNIIPIEVKSGHNAKLKSLHIFMENTNHNIGVRVWSQPFSIDNVITASGKVCKLVNLPFYYVGQLESVLTDLLSEE